MMYGFIRLYVWQNNNYAVFKYIVDKLTATHILNMILFEIDEELEKSRKGKQILCFTKQY